VAHLVGVQRCIVRKWAERFLDHRIEGLYDVPGRGAKGFFSPRGRRASGQTGLRATGSSGSQSFAMGLSRTGSTTGGERDG
jgi:hypothetical protein